MFTTMPELACQPCILHVAMHDAMHAAMHAAMYVATPDAMHVGKSDARPDTVEHHNNTNTVAACDTTI